MEIERKWLIDKLPPFPYRDHWRVYQFYLSVIPEVRVRRTVKDTCVEYQMTIKSAASADGLTREEYEFPITETDYDEMLKRFINRAPVEKEDYIYDFDGHTIEVSRVDDGKFMYAEIEFDNETEARIYEFPWANVCHPRDVTDEARYKMKNYWANNGLQRPID